MAALPAAVVEKAAVGRLRGQTPVPCPSAMGGSGSGAVNAGGSASASQREAALRLRGLARLGWELWLDGAEGKG